VNGEAFNRKRAEDAKKSGPEKKFETRNLSDVEGSQIRNNFKWSKIQMFQTSPFWIHKCVRTWRWEFIQRRHPRMF